MRLRLRLVLVAIAVVVAASPRAQNAAAGLGQAATLTGRVSSAGSRDADRQPTRVGATVLLLTIANEVAYDTPLDEDLQFAFRDVRPGTYIVALKRERHHVELGRVLLRAGMTLRRDYSKGVVIAGGVRDERGAPVSSVTVCLLRDRRSSGNERFVPVASTRTDARGRYLLGERLDLSRGNYIAAVMPAGCGVSHTPDAVAAHLLKYPPTYFPSAARPEDATAMELVPEVDEEVDITMRPGPATRLEGRLLGYVNTVIVPGIVILEPPEGAVSIVTTTQVTRDGRFAFAGLTPGRYRILSAPRKGPDPPRWGEQVVELNGEQVVRVVVPLQQTQAIGGTIEFAGHLNALYGTRIFLSVAAIREGERPATAALLPAVYDAVGTDGRFGITGVMPGRYRLDVHGANTVGWHMKSAVLPSIGPRLAPPDAFDVPFEVSPGRSVLGIQIFMTYRENVVTGRIEEADGRPTPGAAALVFATDARYWTTLSRRVVQVRTGTDGTFQVSGLPEGDYLAVPVRSPVPLPAPELLESLRYSAVALPLGDGDTRAIALRFAEMPSNCHTCAFDRGMGPRAESITSKQLSGRGRNQLIISRVY